MDPSVSPQARYTASGRRAAARLVRGLGATALTPNMLTASGVTLCLAAAGVLVTVEGRLGYWLAGTLFLVGSLLDVLDGALARVADKVTRFGAFLDSTTDRVGEGALLAAVAVLLARRGDDWAVGGIVLATAGSFLVPYVRSKAEALGIAATVGLGARAERVTLLLVGLALAPWGALPYAGYALAALSWLTVLQRVLHVRRQLAL
jgi:CDP-diacylglycerol--glycerol-3-phosphate 3-phosphatidyltransferase